MIDAEAYLAQVLRTTVDATIDELLAEDPGRSLEHPSITPDIDVETMRDLPAITWNLVGDGQAANADGLYTFVLSASIFGAGMDQAKNHARALDKAVMGWDVDPYEHVLIVDGDRINIAGVERIDMPSRLSGPIVAVRNLTQYAGSYAVALRG